MLLSETPAVTDRASTGGVTWVDYDGDGDLDLFVTNGYDVSAAEAVPQANRLYRNDGSGRLEAVEGGPLATDSGFSSGSTWGDYDDDGDLDVFVSNQRGQDNFLYRNEGGGRFVRVDDAALGGDGGSSFSASWVDVDGDGWLDLYVANGGLGAPEPDFLYRNRGDGSFERMASGPIVEDTAASGGGAWGDYDDDGDPDLYVASRWTPGRFTNALFRNEGGFRFTRVREGAAATDSLPSIAAAWGDHDGDGDLDLFVSNLFGLANALYRNEGGGALARVPAEGRPELLDGGSTYGASWADRDNDGDLDLLAVNWGAAPAVYDNRGDGTFDRVVAGDLGARVGHASSLAWGDLEGDGDLDVYIGHWPDRPGEGERNALYRNEGPVGHWLRARLVGTESNRAGIGARVTVRAAGHRGRVQVRELVAHTSWRSQDEPVLHFGLGEATRAEELVVRWPSGRAERWTDLEADRTVELVEGSGQAVR